jgi:hypothetical protein
MASQIPVTIGMMDVIEGRTNLREGRRWVMGSVGVSTAR